MRSHAEPWWGPRTKRPTAKTWCLAELLDQRPAGAGAELVYFQATETEGCTWAYKWGGNLTFHRYHTPNTPGPEIVE